MNREKTKKKKQNKRRKHVSIAAIKVHGGRIGKATVQTVDLVSGKCHAIVYESGFPFVHWWMFALLCMCPYLKIIFLARRVKEH